MEDFQFAALNFIGILFFYEKFPQLRDQDIYLTGEQYAGITIPQIALLITEINNDPTIPIWQKLKFKGFLLENPCTLGD